MSEYVAFVIPTSEGERSAVDPCDAEAHRQQRDAILRTVSADE